MKRKRRALVSATAASLPASPAAVPATRRVAAPMGARRHRPASELRITLAATDALVAGRIEGLLRAAEPALAVEHVDSVAAVMGVVEGTGCDAVLCAPRLNDGDAVDVARQVRTRSIGVPLIVMTDGDTDTVVNAAREAGADGHINSRESDAARMLERICQAIAHASARRDPHYLANYDNLTGLANRELFRDRLQQALLRAERGQRMVALLSLDIDRFRTVNDALGHGGGDELLITVASRLKSCVRRRDTIARVGSDEFAVIVEDVEHTDDVDTVCQKIMAALGEAVLVRGEQIYVSTSLGVTLYPEDAVDTAALRRNADAAMNRARADGRGRWRRFTPELEAAGSETVQLEAGLRQALAEDAFFLCYQPQLSLQTGEVVGVEALLRWRHPRLGVIMPARFIPLAEDSGLIMPIGEWVLRRACLDQRRWHERGHDEMTVAVNLSACQFRRGDLGAMVETVIDETGADPNQLVFEITESVLLEDSDHSRVQLDALKAMGVMVYLDDFGMGYSSLSYLRRFSIDGLKIDRSFIRDIAGNPDDGALTRAIIALGQALRLGVTAEGVENEAQLELLIREGCDQVQGYFFSQPVPFEELMHRLPGGCGRDALAAVASAASANMAALG